MSNSIKLILFLILLISFQNKSSAEVLEICNLGPGNYLIKKHKDKDFPKKSVRKLAGSEFLECYVHKSSYYPDFYETLKRNITKTKKTRKKFAHLSHGWTHKILDKTYLQILKDFNQNLQTNQAKLSKKTQIAKAVSNDSDFEKYNFCSETGTIQLSNCWKGESDFDRFLIYYLTKRSKAESDVKRTEQEIFDRELLRLLEEFKVYNFESSKIFDGIKRNKKLKDFLNNSKNNFAQKKPKKKISTNTAEKFYIDIEFNVGGTNNVRLVRQRGSKKLITFEEWKKRKTYFNESGLCYTPKQQSVNYFHTADSCMNVRADTSYNIKYYSNPKDKTYTFEYWGDKKIASLDWNSRTSPIKKKVKVAKKESEQKGDLKTWRAEVTHPFTDEIFKSEIITKNKKSAINEALGSCYKFVNNYNLENPEGKLKIKNKWLKKGTKNKWKISTTGFSDCKISKTFEIREKIKVAEKEQTVKHKKKVKVAKVEEPKQEEFKPDNNDIDTEAPIIEIASNFKFKSQAFEINGKVKDKSKLFVSINDRPVKVNSRGKFKFEGFVVDPEKGEELKIVAIDQWNNKQEKTVKINIEFEQVADSRTYEKPNPNKIKVKKDSNKIGIIIGIEKYQTLKNIDAPFANRDANAFRAYANRALGIPNQNLKVLIDDKATRAELLKSLKIWLPQIGRDKDIYIFFAGHGLASDNGEDLHILPQDGDPILLEDTAISRVEMFDLINKVSPNSVTMFFDTCYSGQTRSEEMLVAGLRPVRIVASEQDTPNNFTIFTASNYDQTSGSIENAQHGIFSYYLMKGLEGKADINADKKITNGELISFLKKNVSDEAFSQNRKQDPMLSGDPDQVLVSF